MFNRTIYVSILWPSSIIVLVLLSNTLILLIFHVFPISDHNIQNPSALWPDAKGTIK
jgi:hypothetical protein